MGMISLLPGPSIVSTTQLRQISRFPRTTLYFFEAVASFTDPRNSTMQSTSSSVFVYMGFPDPTYTRYSGLLQKSKGKSYRSRIFKKEAKNSDSACASEVGDVQEPSSQQEGSGVRSSARKTTTTTSPRASISQARLALSNRS
jgi:hypothetical protein